MTNIRRLPNKLDRSFRLKKRSKTIGILSAEIQFGPPSRPTDRPSDAFSSSAAVGKLISGSGEKALLPPLEASRSSFRSRPPRSMR